MMQIAFQNKPEDLTAFADYMARETAEGIRVGKQAYRNIHSYYLALASLAGLAAWVLSGSEKVTLLVYLGFFLLAEVFLLVSSRMEPRFYLARKAYLAQEKEWTPKDIERMTMSRELSANSEYLEISSSTGLRRCSWSCIEKIGVTPDFIFVHVGGCPIVYVPRRDFPSEAAFKEFGSALSKLWREHESPGATQAAS